MATETEKRRPKRLHVEGDQMPYVWPRGPEVGPVIGKRIWQILSVLMLFVLIAVIAYAAWKSWR